MKHPSESQLALYAGGDLDLVERWRVGHHVRGCRACEAEMSAFRAAAEALKTEGAVLPGGVRWDQLASEMTANIHVGLEAGECVGPARVVRDRLGWRAVAVMASMTGVLLVAWWWNPAERRGSHALQRPRIELRTTAAGIELNDNGSALTLMHTRGRQKPIIVSAPGTLRARFVDPDSGQITINNVFTE
jgi:hypothetical protein